jgi:hypothetical protein
MHEGIDLLAELYADHSRSAYAKRLSASTRR